MTVEEALDRIRRQKLAGAWQIIELMPNQPFWLYLLRKLDNPPENGNAWLTWTNGIDGFRIDNRESLKEGWGRLQGLGQVSDRCLKRKLRLL